MSEYSTKAINDLLEKHAITLSLDEMRSPEEVARHYNLLGNMACSPDVTAEVTQTTV